jgi:membrane-associated protease RseP (regulator of RpoE activity)
LLPLLAVAAFSARQHPGFDPSTQSYGVSSEDSFGGGSYLGVDTRDVTPDRLAPLHLKEEHGVEVTMVDQDAPAGKSGIKEHDVILSVNGTPVESVEQLRRMIHEIPPGRVVTLGVTRNGQPLTLKAQLSDRKSSFSSSMGPKDFHFEMPPMPNLQDMDLPVSVVVVHSSMRSGLMVENLTPQLGEFFGAKGGKGILIRSVEKGSRGEKAGFRAGDVIVRVNEQEVSDTGDFAHVLRSRKKDDKASVTIVRDKKEQTLTLTLAPSGQTGEILNESFDIPEIDAAAQLALSRAGDEIARLKPEFERVQQYAAELALKSSTMQPATCQGRKQHEHLKKQMQEKQQELSNRRRELREKLKLELGGSRADI